MLERYNLDRQTDRQTDRYYGFAYLLYFWK